MVPRNSKVAVAVAMVVASYFWDGPTRSTPNSRYIYYYIVCSVQYTRIYISGLLDSSTLFAKKDTRMQRYGQHLLVCFLILRK